MGALCTHDGSGSLGLGPLSSRLLCNHLRHGGAPHPIMLIVHLLGFPTGPLSFLHGFAPVFFSLSFQLSAARLALTLRS